MTLEEKLALAWRIRLENFPKEIEFDYPFQTAVVSLTGPYCALDCAHCGGHYLRHMKPIWEAEAKGAKSLLISGGCDSRGRVPVTAYLEKVKALRQGRKMNWHVGLIEEEKMRQIAPYVDLISFDFVGDDETIRQVYGLSARVEDYVRTYQMLRRYAQVLPHLTIGLKGGKLAGEYRALEILAELGAGGLVFLVFIPTPGTRYADLQPPAVEEAAEVIATARQIFPQKPIYLGCMRPYGEYRARLDCLAIRAGVNKIVSPDKEAVYLAKRLGLKIKRGEECCALNQMKEELS